MSLTKAIVSSFYTRGTAAHRWLTQKGFLAQHQISRPVVSIGNLTVGGSGKTPLALFLLQELKKKQIKTAFISRSYKADLKESQILPQNPEPEVFGDEACLVKHRDPQQMVISGPVKWKSAQLAAQQEGVQVVLLDDGFQHHALKQNYRFLVFDLSRPFSEQIWRDDLSLAKESQAIFLNRGNPEQEMEVKKILLQNNVRAPVFRIQPQPLIIENFDPVSDTIMVTGIGHPEAFFSMVQKQFPDLKLQMQPFSDHHPFSKVEIETLEAQAQAQGVRQLLCTEKDWVKITQLTKNSIWKIARLQIRVEPSHQWDVFFAQVCQEILP